MTSLLVPICILICMECSRCFSRLVVLFASSFASLFAIWCCIMSISARPSYLWKLHSLMWTGSEHMAHEACGQPTLPTSYIPVLSDRYEITWCTSDFIHWTHKYMYQTLISLVVWLLLGNLKFLLDIRSCTWTIYRHRIWNQSFYIRIMGWKFVFDMNSYFAESTL